MLATDATWQSGLLPIIKSGIYFGEIYDAREEKLTATDGVALVDDFDDARLIPHETTAVQELEPFAGRQQLHRCRGPHGLRFRPEHRRLCAPSRSTASAAPRSPSSTPKSSTRTASSTTSTTAPPKRGSNTCSRASGDESYTPTFTFFGFRYARVTIEGKAEDRLDRGDPDQLGDQARRRLSPRPVRWSTGWSRTPSGRSAAISSKCRPIARSATSASAGPATRRCSRRPPATSTTATTSCANICAT